MAYQLLSFHDVLIGLTLSSIIQALLSLRSHVINKCMSSIKSGIGVYRKPHLPLLLGTGIHRYTFLVFDEGTMPKDYSDVIAMDLVDIGRRVYWNFAEQGSVPLSLE